MRLSAKHEPKINIIWTSYLIYSANLPLGVGVGVTIELLKEEIPAGRCVLLEYGVLESASI